MTPPVARVEHINGDWYKLIPNENFLLEPGDSVSISYFGTEGVIKESDRPMGLYFVFYDDEGEERIAEVTDFHFVPFTKSEQVRRGPEDEEPIPTPEWIHKQNKDLSLLQASEVKKIIPSPVKVETGKGGYNYRIPPPGAVITAGKLYASTSFPGLTIRYSTDGTEPDENDPLYEGPVEVTGKVVVTAFDRAGNSSRPMYLDCTLDTGAIYPCPD